MLIKHYRRCLGSLSNDFDLVFVQRECWVYGSGTVVIVFVARVNLSHSYLVFSYIVLNSVIHIFVLHALKHKIGQLVKTIAFNRDNAPLFHVVQKMSPVSRSAKCCLPLESVKFFPRSSPIHQIKSREAKTSLPDPNKTVGV